jgi:alkylation response protein AidB-like acyl-CoA dehydrogenase
MPTAVIDEQEAWAGADVALSPATRRLCAEVREWAVTVGRPFARAGDRLHRPPDGLAATRASCPIQANPLVGDLVNPYAAPGSMGVSEDGSHVLGVAVVEEIAYGDISLVYLLGGRGIGTKVIALLGTPEQVARWNGPHINHTGFALTEPGCGSDASKVATTAVRTGDSWVINGTKIYTSFGAVSDYVVVFATIDPGFGSRGIRCFVVEAGTPGFSVAKANEAKLGLRSSITSELVFDNVVVPDDHCLGAGDIRSTAFQSALRTLSTTRPLVAAQAVGIAQAAMDVSRAIVERDARSLTTARRARTADLFERMAEALERARLLSRRAAWRIDQGLPFTIESSIAKAYGCQLAERVCLRAAQLMGPDGYSEQYLVEKWHRDIKITDIYEGTGNIHRMIIARSLFADAARSS